MQQRDGDRRLHLRGHAVHGVGAHHDEIGSAALQPKRRLLHGIGKSIPVAFMLKVLDLLEIDGEHQALRRMHATEPTVHFLIDDAVILGRALPAHAADQPDGLHDGL